MIRFISLSKSYSLSLTDLKNLIHEKRLKNIHLLTLLMFNSLNEFSDLFENVWRVLGRKIEAKRFEK